MKPARKAIKVVVKRVRKMSKKQNRYVHAHKK